MKKLSLVLEKLKKYYHPPQRAELLHWLGLKLECKIKLETLPCVFLSVCRAEVVGVLDMLFRNQICEYTGLDSCVGFQKLILYCTFVSYVYNFIKEIKTIL